MEISAFPYALLHHLKQVLQYFFWLSFMHRVASLDEGFVQIDKHIEQCQPGVIFLIRNSGPYAEHFARLDRMCFYSLDGCMYIVAGPEVERIIVKFPRNRFSLFVLFKAIRFQGHHFCLSAMSGPLMLALEGHSNFHRLFVKTGKLKWSVGEIFVVDAYPLLLDSGLILGISDGTLFRVLVAHVAHTKENIYQSPGHPERFGRKASLH